MTSRPLNVIALDGINTDSLGQYLAGLGVLSAVSQKWPEILGCWRNGRFVLLARSLTIDEVERFLSQEWRQTPYRRWWATSQKKDTKAKSSQNLWAERNNCAADEITVLDAHIVPLRRNQFNPILGTGGNIGKRNLEKAVEDAQNLLKKPDSVEWLHTALTGEQKVGLPDFSNAGTWFVHANKTFNSGQSWYREGKLSPWAFLLALGGALLLSGGANKRLGSRARPYAVFPFISDPASPETAGQVGASKGEFWAPLWAWPATILEVRSLFQRGLARLGGNPARAPHEFAVAVLAAGVDAGIVEFARFELRQTTSSQVYEAIPCPHIRVRRSERNTNEGKTEGSPPSPVESHLLMELIESRWLDQRRLFEPRDSKQRGKFVGIRGPVEVAIIHVTEQPEDTVRWQSLLLRLAAAQFRIDRNKNLRDDCRPLPLLSLGWFEKAWPPEQRPDEIELAAAIASVSHWPSPEELRGRNTVPTVPLLVNVFGVEVHARAGQRGKMRFDVRFPKARPQRVVWHRGDPLQNLTDVAHRRLVDAMDSKSAVTNGSYWCRGGLIDRLLNNDSSLDLQLIAQWVPALALLNWAEQTRQQRRGQTHSAAVKAEADSSGVRNWGEPEPDGVSLLDAFFRPFFQPQALWIGGGSTRRLLFDPDPVKNEWPTPTITRRLFNLVRQGTINDAVEFAQGRYLAAQCPTVPLPVSVHVDPLRLAAGLLVPMKTADLQSRFERWIQPAKAEF